MNIIIKSCFSYTLNNCGGLGNAFGVDCIGEGNRRVRGLYLMWNDKITHSGYNFFSLSTLVTW